MEKTWEMWPQYSTISKCKCMHNRNHYVPYGMVNQSLHRKSIFQKKSRGVAIMFELMHCAQFFTYKKLRSFGRACKLG